MFADLGALGKLEITERTSRQAQKKGKKAVPSSWRMTLQTTSDEAAIIDIFSYFAQPEQVRIEAEPAGAAGDRLWFVTDRTPPKAMPATDFSPTRARLQKRRCGYGFFVDVSAPWQNRRPRTAMAMASSRQSTRL